MSPLANSKMNCSRCHGAGVDLTKGGVCQCVVTRQKKELEKCKDKWEQLWLESHRNPSVFPPYVGYQSSLSEWI